MYLSYLMGAKNITDIELTQLGIEIVETRTSGNRTLKIPEEKINHYQGLIRTKLDPGFWNEMISSNEIVFIFKFSDGTIREFILSTDNEREVDELCARFNNQVVPEVSNVYKWLSENSFYHNFMVSNYLALITR